MVWTQTSRLLGTLRSPSSSVARLVFLCRFLIVLVVSFRVFLIKFWRNSNLVKIPELAAVPVNDSVAAVPVNDSVEYRFVCIGFDFVFI